MKRVFIIILNLVLFFITFINSGIVLGNEESNEEVEEGIYELYTCVNGTKVVDIGGSSQKDGANVEIYERGNQRNQKFEIKLNEDGSYSFVAQHSKKVLDVANNRNVSQYGFHGGDNQKWYLKDCGDGYYNIISKVNGLYLDVTAAQGRDGQNIQVYEGHGGVSQKFKLSKVIEIGSKTIEDGIYNIHSEVAENRLLEVPNSSIKDEADIKTASNNNKANQKFQLLYNKDGTYTITALHSGKALDVQCGSGKNETPIQQYTKHGGESQKWIIIQNSNKTYSLIAKCSGLALDIKARNTQVGASVQTYCFHGQKSQQFTFEPCKTEIGSQTAEDGTYRILSSVNNKKVFEVANSSTENGAKLLMWENTRNIQQKFDIEYTGEGYYKIKSKISNKVLTVESENPEVGSSIKQEEDENLDTQKWILKKYSESVYGIVSKCGNLYITLHDSTIQNGQELQLKGETNLKEQQFILVNETPKEGIITKLEDGVYQITTKGNKVIDISGTSYNEAANVLIWKNEKNQNQKYQITRIENTDYYKIVAVHSAKSLDVQNGDMNPGANIIQYSYAGTNNQQWLLKDCGDGYYNIISRKSGLYLDITAGQISRDGANIELWYDNGADAQKFKLEPINIIDNNTYEIETRLDANKVIDISGASGIDGANALLWEASNVNHERFVMEALSTDIYKIMAKHSNKALTADTDTNNVYQAIYAGTDNQQWKIQTAGNGYYNLICKANGKALAVSGGLAQNGQNIQVENFQNENSQQFRFITGIRKFYEEGIYGKTGLAIAGDGRGTNLKYYKFGRGSKVLFATFSIHGFEDSYNHDGVELTYLAEEFKKYLANNIDETIVNNWTIYIFPTLNPDGQTYGWSNNGPGRTTLYSAEPENRGIDMNRNWSIGYKRETSERNYNGTEAFQAYENRYLRDFILSHQGSKNILVDTHGWLNETIGDDGLGAYYRNQFGLPSHIYSYGAGYLINWARTVSNTRSVLVELPEVSNHSQVVNRNYAQKYINATMQMLREN